MRGLDSGRKTILRRKRRDAERTRSDEDKVVGGGHREVEVRIEVGAGRVKR